MFKLIKYFFSGKLSGFLLVVSAFGLGLKLYLDGYVSAEKFAIFILLAVVASVMDSAKIKIILLLFSIGFYLLQKSNYNYNEFSVLATYTCGILIMLFGFYVMFGGMNKKRR